MFEIKNNVGISQPPNVSCFMFLISMLYAHIFIFLNFQAYFLLRNCQHTCLQKLFLKSKNSFKEYFVEQKQIKSTTAATPNFECLAAKHVMFAPNQ